jgi:hypothetical protein
LLLLAIQHAFEMATASNTWLEDVNTVVDSDEMYEMLVED